jgi:hypothetical protein
VKKLRGRPTKAQSHNQLGGIQLLPLEVILRILRHLVPTGGIFQCASTVKQVWQASEGDRRELDSSVKTDDSGSYVKQTWHVIRHITTHKPTQHRFFPISSAQEYRHVTAVSRTCRRLNQAWNMLLYGENSWLLEMSGLGYCSSQVLVNRSLMRDAEIISPWPEGEFSFPYLPTCHTVIRPTLYDAANTSAAAWPLSTRAAQHVRDLLISGRTSTDFNPRDGVRQRYGGEETTALATQVEAVVNTFLGAPGERHRQEDLQHSLQRLAVQIVSWNSGSRWKLEEAINRRSNPDYGDSKGQCLRLSMCRDMPVDGKSRPHPLPKAVWAPLGRFKGVREVELAGRLTSATAKALTSSMTSTS